VKKYKVYARITGGKYLGEYEAATEDEAIEKAIKEAGSVSLCHQCSRQIDDLDIDEVFTDIGDHDAQD